MQNPKKKGNRAEKDWAQRLRHAGIDPGASRNYGSGSGLAKSDVHNSLGYEFEVKHVERLNIWDAIAEAEEHAHQAHTIPLPLSLEEIECQIRMSQYQIGIF